MKCNLSSLFVVIGISFFSLSCHTLHAQCDDYLLDWTNYKTISGGYPSGGLSYTVVETDSNPSSVTMEMQIGGTTSALVVGTESLSSVSSPLVTEYFYQSEDCLIIAVEGTEMENSEQVTYTVSFSQPVNISFSLFDVDGNDNTEIGANRHEIITISGIDNTDSEITPILTGSTANAISQNTVTGLTPSAPSSSAGNVLVDFGNQWVTSFTITFSIAFTEVPTNNTEPGFGIFDFNFCTQATLAIQWGEISAVQEHDNVVIRWSVSDESNGDYFEVEKSKNNRDWFSIGVIDALNEKVYTLIDNVSGEDSRVSYYRIKGVDNDGRYSYSQVVKTKLTEGKGDIVFPNPAQDVITIQTSCDPDGFSIIDVLGRKIPCTFTIEDDGLISANITTLTSGIYFVKSQTSSTLFVKH